ncbi:MAG TPA: hypothetical protein PLS50_06910 [Candidatus Dojkabacteria bacterium]|nr:hypothetical protein [Candidatus Dojkabacteria bacterium]
MGVDYLYCGKCEDCYHADDFRRCNMCDELFDAECCGYLCVECDHGSKKKVNFEGKEYFLYLHDDCHKNWFKRAKPDFKADVIDEHGLLCPQPEES